MPIITRSAGAADYGIWVQITAMTALIPPVFALNLHHAVIRFGLNASAEAARSLFRQIAVRVVALSFLGALLLTALILLLDLQDPRQRSLLLECTWLAPPVALCKLGIGHVRGRGQVKRASLLEACLRLTAVGSAALAFSLKQGVEGALLALIAVFSVFALSMTLPKFTPRSIAADLRSRKDGIEATANSLPQQSIATYLQYALPTIPAALADWSLFAIDRYVLGLLIDNSAAGVYSATYSIALLMRLFGAPISYALLPAVGKLWDRKKQEEAVQLTADAALLTIVVCALAGVLLTRNGSWILRQLSTAAIAEGADPLLPYLTFGLVLWTVTRVFIQLFVAEKRTGDMARVMISSALLNLVCNFVLIKAMGAVGAAVATLISYGFALVYALYLLRGTLTIQWWSVKSLRLGSSLVALVVALLVVPRTNCWAGIFLEGILFGVGFGAVLLATQTVQLPAAWKRKFSATNRD